MGKSNNKPRIRFKGFTDAWEQRKFSDFTFPAGERNKDDLDLEPFAITNNQGFIAQSEAHDDLGYMKDVDRKMYIVVKPNSFAYNPARINVGSLGYYEGTENVIVSSLYEVFQTAEYVDDKFLKHWFKTKAFQDWIERLQEGSVRLYFYYDKLCECIMSMPSVEEQRKIGAYLDKIDNLITLHQRKYEKLLNIKKSMLEKMFPKNGSKFPEIRFSGFTEAWEQRKFSDFTQRESVVQLSSYDCPCVEYEDVIAEEGRLNKDIRQKEVQKSGIKFDGTQVLYGKLRPYLHNWLNPDFTGVAVGDWWVLRPICIDKNYLYRLLQTKQFDDVANQSAGSKMPRADWNLVSNTEFFIPASTEEQSKIAMTFTNLDSLITLHQHKLEKLKNIKKSMLEKMFV
ncbi:MAG: restriction endonuclease subunit S [Lachnospiraceae bacterium]|nr:restriction endonuclease subunit S [Lachnospiraceae bacterium]